MALLIAAAIKNYVGRETIEPPKWLGKLQEADAAHAFRTGLLVIMFMPSDLIVMATVAINLQSKGQELTAAVPFVLATALIAALPVLGYLIFHRRAVHAMPEATRLDECQQLAGQHHRVRDLHRADPLARRAVRVRISPAAASRQ